VSEGNIIGGTSDLQEGFAFIRAVITKEYDCYLIGGSECGEFFLRIQLSGYGTGFLVDPLNDFIASSASSVVRDCGNGTSEEFKSWVALDFKGLSNGGLFSSIDFSKYDFIALRSQCCSSLDVFRS
jgi:hypothetical protein